MIDPLHSPQFNARKQCSEGVLKQREFTSKRFEDDEEVAVTVTKDKKSCTVTVLN